MRVRIILHWPGRLNANENNYLSANDSHSRKGGLGGARGFF